MGFRAVISEKKYFNQLLNGDDFASNLTEFNTVFTSELTEFNKFWAKIQLSFNSEPDTLSGEDFTVNPTTITRDIRSFVADGFAIGDTFNLFKGGVLQQSGIGILNISAQYISVDTTLTVTGTADDWELRGTTDLTASKYTYGFPNNSDPSPLNSRIDGLTMNFKANDINVSIAKDGVYSSDFPTSKDGEFTILKIATGDPYVQEFEITHTFLTKGWGLPNDKPNIFNKVLPEFLQSDESIRHYFDLKFGKDNTDNLNEQKTLLFNQEKGNVGGWNERFNQGVAQFKLDSVTYVDTVSGDPVDNLQIDNRTTVEILIGSDTGIDFNVNHLASLAISYLGEEDEYTENQDDFRTNWVFENSVNQQGQPAKTTGDFIKSFEIQAVSATQMKLVAEVEYSASQKSKLLTDNRKYYLSAVCRASNDVISDSRTNVYVDADGYLNDNDIQGLMELNQIDFRKGSWTGVEEEKTTDLETFVQCEHIAESSFTIDRNEGAYLKSLSVSFIAYNDVTGNYFDLIKYTKDLSSIPLSSGVQNIQDNSSQNFTTPIDSVFNQFNLNFDSDTLGISTYNLSVGLQIGWMDYLKSIFPVDNVFYDPLILNDGQNQDFSRYSSNFDYNVRFLVSANVANKDNGADSVDTVYDFITPVLKVQSYNSGFPSTIFFEGSVDIQSLSNISTNGFILQNTQGLISATFSPTTPLGGSEDLFGEIYLEKYQDGGYQSLFRLSTIQDFSSNSNPLSPKIGENFVTLDNNLTSVVLECVLSPAILSDISNGAQYRISGFVEGISSGDVVPEFAFITEAGEPFIQEVAGIEYLIQE
jgi:hypothetical protein